MGNTLDTETMEAVSGDKNARFQKTVWGQIPFKTFKLFTQKKKMKDEWLHCTFWGSGVGTSPTSLRCSKMDLSMDSLATPGFYKDKGFSSESWYILYILQLRPYSGIWAKIWLIPSARALQRNNIKHPPPKNLNNFKTGIYKKVGHLKSWIQMISDINIVFRNTCHNFKCFAMVLNVVQCVEAMRLWRKIKWIPSAAVGEANIALLWLSACGRDDKLMMSFTFIIMM